MVIMLALFTTSSNGQQTNECLAGKHDRAFFDALKQNGFKPDAEMTDDALSMLLADCLGNPDSEIRDGIAYEGLVVLLRGARVSDRGKRGLLEKCENALNPKKPDPDGFLKPFSALCVAEVARTDRIKPYMTELERSDIVKVGTRYLKSINDYRGFDGDEGWRHGVAHTADLLMQLTLNDQIGVDHHRAIINAIASQITPKGVFYTYGEPARLARPVIFIAMKGKIKETEWTTWFNDIVRPGPELNDWAEAFNSQSGLAKRHNITAFLSAIYINASQSDDENVKSLLPGTLAAMNKVP